VTFGRRRWFQLFLVIGLLVGGLALWYGGWPRTPVVRGPDPVAELLKLEIGGLEQWILIRGEDRPNPILLWLHGGPGATQMPVHRAYNQALEKDFVVVHWDQRGAGKSNHGGFREETMTLDRFVEDVREVTAYLTDRFDRDHILLVGHSWGALLGMHTVARHPNDYLGFVSVAQPVHADRADLLSHEWLERQVTEFGSETEREEFDALGPPPFQAHTDYVAFAHMKDRFGGSMDRSMQELTWRALRATEYSWLDYRRWLEGANRGSGPMWDEIGQHDLFSRVPAVQVPVWFIVGERDYNTPAVLVAEYHEKLEASRGAHLMVMEGVSHTPHLGDPEAFHAELRKVRSKVADPGFSRDVKTYAIPCRSASTETFSFVPGTVGWLGWARTGR